LSLVLKIILLISKIGTSNQEILIKID